MIVNKAEEKPKEKPDGMAQFISCSQIVSWWLDKEEDSQCQACQAPKDGTFFCMLYEAIASDQRRASVAVAILSLINFPEGRFRLN